MTSQLTIRWNKDHSISIYSRGKVVQKFQGSYAYERTESFLTGWFLDGARNVKWVVAR
jgi:hypothetical protein